MQYRTLSDTDFSLPVITFGAWAAGGWMWGSTERKDAVDAIRAAWDLGVTAIDTAPIYGQGTSEEIVGEAIKGLDRSRVQILTKYGLRWDLDRPQGKLHLQSRDNAGKEIDIYRFSGRDSVIKECEDSLRRMRTDYIDLYQIHWPDATTPVEETMEAVSRLIEQGKVRYAGVCNYSAEEMRAAAAHIKLVSNQVPYSMVKRKIEKEVIPYCIAENKSILAYSPLERGLLTGKMSPGHRFAAGDHRADLSFFRDVNLTRTGAFLETLKPLANDKGATIAQLVLAWTLRRPGITIALVGARNADQAIANARAAEVTLTNEEMNFITRELGFLELER